MTALILILLSAPSLAQDVPYYPRTLDHDQDRGALNQNLRDLADRNRDLVNGSAVPQNTCFGNESFCVDSTNYRIGIGTEAPTVGLDVKKEAAFASTVTFNGPVIFNTPGISTLTVYGTFLSSNSVSLSSQSYIYQDAALGASDFPKCVSGSTVSVTLPETARVRYSFAGTVYTNGASYTKFWVLRDSAIRVPFTGTTAGIAVVAQYSLGALADTDMSFFYIEQLSSGTHTFCITGYSGGASMNFGNTTAGHESICSVLAERLP